MMLTQIDLTGGIGCLKVSVSCDSQHGIADFASPTEETAFAD